MVGYKAVVFDLDGTLLDTIEDLADSLNATLLENEFQTLTVEEVRARVGNGLRNLVELSVPAEADVDAITHAFKAYYFDHYNIKTAPYSVVLPVLKNLKDNGIKVAIVSNKAHDAVQALWQAYFKDFTDVALGEQVGVPRKPAPDLVYKALDALEVDAADTVYVGDSEVDFKTAQNSGMDCILVSWGFRDRCDLEALGQVRIADTGAELQEMLDGK